ncbi:MAG: CDP-diacylglycerol--glycerol-3-phosphate 3-phosphatidyltransferase [Deltaproteobacteria bacterium RBG_16_48_10]|nr:MAG: CDP-diacylglycerol--glycerol-3-phosphate 3-phosphatidyltransferase [Deltaproteobacteria bacterium RBG_16_48_10]
MEKLNRDQIMTLPNGVTIIRVIAIPFILVMLFYPGQFNQFITALLFFAAAITDTLDGYLARRRRMVTTLGKFLDPLADKLLIATALIALIPARGIPTWMVIVIVGREIAVTGLRGIAVSQNIIISSNIWGKYKTFFEGASIFFFILNGGFASFSFYWLGLGLLWVALLLAVFSGADYFQKFLRSIIV